MLLLFFNLVMGCVFWAPNLQRFVVKSLKIESAIVFVELALPDGSLVPHCTVGKQTSVRNCRKEVLAECFMIHPLLSTAQSN